MRTGPTFCRLRHLVAQRIRRELTLLRRGLWLHGGNMGGGFGRLSRSIWPRACPATATQDAAKAIHDNVDVVRGMGWSFVRSA